MIVKLISLFVLLLDLLFLIYDSCLLFFLNFLNILVKEGDNYMQNSKEMYENALKNFDSFPVPEQFKEKGEFMSKNYKCNSIISSNEILLFIIGRYRNIETIEP